MAWPAALTLMFGLVCLAMLIGLPVAFAFFLTNIVRSDGGTLSCSLTGPLPFPSAPWQLAQED